jgi:hypothetical protein
MRLEVIRQQLAESETDRAARLEVIQNLDHQVLQGEADRAAAWNTARDFESRLRELESNLLVRSLRKLHLVHPADRPN